jgi:hypothetical protein
MILQSISVPLRRKKLYNNNNNNNNNNYYYYYYAKAVTIGLFGVAVCTFIGSRYVRLCPRGYIV